MKLIGEHIVLSQDAVSYLKNFLSGHDYSKVIVLVDSNTSKYCLPMIDYPFDAVIEIEAGEEHKNLSTCQRIWEEMLTAGADRHSVLVNLGGGVIGDMGGFCASTYMRGIDFIQGPTTLLAMVDASVGGKLGVDFQNGKNLIGLFREPVMNFIHVPFLRTLDDRQWMSGYAEMLKHGLILSQPIWDGLKEVQVRRTMLQIEESIGVKRSVVEEDPEESAYRKVLNFGHTVGHGLESLALERRMDVLHGEAIAAGMLIESILSSKTGLTRESIQEIKEVILQLYPKLSFEVSDAESIWNYMLKDKKNKRAQVHCTLLSSIGKAEVDRQISFPEFKEAFLNYLNDV